MTESARVGRGPTFTVLGPVRGWRGDEEIDIGTARQRCVLAFMLLRVGQPVSRDEIIDAVWGDSAPRNVASAVHTYIHGIRRALRRGVPSWPRMPASTRSGYVMDIEPYRIDLQVFETAVADAERARATERPEAAASCYRRALDLWKGPALAGMEGPFADMERVSLAERYLRVLEDRFDTELDLGRTHVVADLRRSVAEHPLRERLLELLMLGLSRAGEPGEAVVVFHQAKDVLRRELGTEPGARLRSLYNRIRAGDWTTVPSMGIVGGHRRPVPAQIPANVPDFVGRVAEIEQISTAFCSGRDPVAVPVRCWTIVGPAGVGKTTLAIRVANLLRERFPGGQIYLNMRGVDTNAIPPSEALAIVLRSLGVPPTELASDVAERSAQFRTLTATRKLLLVLDDARDLPQVRSLLPGGESSAVIVTSRDALIATTGVACSRLAPFTDAEAIEFIGRFERTGGADPAAAGAVARCCGNLPLALRVAGARAGGLLDGSLRALAERLADERNRLGELDLPDVSVRTSFALSVRLLVEKPDIFPPAKALDLLGLLDAAAIPRTVAAALLGVTPTGVDKPLDELLRVHLLGQDRPGWYRMHDLIRLYARERVLATVSEQDRHAAIERVLRHLLSVAGRAARQVQQGVDRSDEPMPDEFPDANTAIRWFHSHRDNLLAAVRQGVDLPGGWQLAARLAHEMKWLFQSQGASEQWEQANEQLLAKAPQHHEHHELLSGILGRLAGLRLDQDDLPASLGHLRAALPICRRAGDVTATIRTLINLGVVHHRRRALDRAERYYRLAQAMARRTGYRAIEPYMLPNLAALYRDRGQHEAAILHDTEAMAISREIGDRYGEAIAVDDLAGSYRAAGRFAEAVAAHHAALSVVRDLGLRPTEAAILGELGETRLRAGDLEGAAEALEQALVIRVDIVDRRGQGRTLRTLGVVHRAAGNVSAARACWHRAADLFAIIAEPEEAQVRALLDNLR